MLQPPLPITLEITVDGTETFFDLRKVLKADGF